MNIIKFIATVVLVLITLPYGIFIFLRADMEYTWTDYYRGKQPPKYIVKYVKFVTIFYN